MPVEVLILWHLVGANDQLPYWLLVGNEEMEKKLETATGFRVSEGKEQMEKKTETTLFYRGVYGDHYRNPFLHSRLTAIKFHTIALAEPFRVVRSPGVTSSTRVHTAAGHILGCC